MHIGGYEWSGKLGEVVVEMPLAKRVRIDYSNESITIDLDSNVAEDQPVV